jgi:hypothetical protein
VVIKCIPKSESLSILLEPSSKKRAIDKYRHAIIDNGWNPFAATMWNVDALKKVKRHQLKALNEFGWSGNQITSQGRHVWMGLLMDRTSEISKSENFVEILKDIGSNFQLVLDDADAMYCWFCGVDYLMLSGVENIDWGREVKIIKSMNFIREGDQRWPSWFLMAQHCHVEIRDCILSMASLDELEMIRSKMNKKNILNKKIVDELELVILRVGIDSANANAKKVSL